MSVIKDLREKLKMSQQELGEAMGVGQTAISNYEVGIRTPDINFAISLRSFASENNIEKKEIPSVESILLKPAA